MKLIDKNAVYSFFMFYNFCKKKKKSQTWIINCFCTEAELCLLTIVSIVFFVIFNIFFCRSPTFLIKIIK